MLVGALKARIYQEYQYLQPGNYSSVLLFVLFRFWGYNHVINVIPIYFQDVASEKVSFQLSMGWVRLHHALRKGSSDLAWSIRYIARNYIERNADTRCPITKPIKNTLQLGKAVPVACLEPLGISVTESDRVRGVSCQALSELGKWPRAHVV